MIVIIDYNVGNVGSIKNMIAKIGFDCIVTSDIDIIMTASRLILPGVGSFDNGMTNIKNLGLIEPLNELVLNKKTPVLGICLGMQLMASGSEEGIMSGLGWIDTTVKKIDPTANLGTTIPIMGWNYVEPASKSRIFESEKQKYYFVHGYYFEEGTEGCVASAKVGDLKYCAAVEKDNIFGVQFHPEKSHLFGLNLLNNFCSL